MIRFQSQPFTSQLTGNFRKLIRNIRPSPNLLTSSNVFTHSCFIEIENLNLWSMQIKFAIFESKSGKRESKLDIYIWHMTDIFLSSMIKNVLFCLEYSTLELVEPEIEINRINSVLSFINLERAKNLLPFRIFSKHEFISSARLDQNANFHTHMLCSAVTTHKINLPYFQVWTAWCTKQIFSSESRKKSSQCIAMC